MNVAFKKLYSVYIGRKLARDIISTTLFVMMKC